MKATDLMIGDYLQYNGMPYRVIQVTGLGGAFMLENGEEDCGEPIPLTKEILEKNGWKKLETAYWWRGGGIPILLDMYDERYGWCLSIDGNHIPFDCKYVHQLQQAMRLCGITKEIEL